MKKKWIYGSMLGLSICLSHEIYAMDEVVQSKIDNKSVPITRDGHSFADAHHQSDEDALIEDLTLVAKARGWTFAEAMADHKVAEEIGAIAVKLSKSRPDIFIGSVLSMEPGGTPSLYVKGVAGKEVHDLVASAKRHIKVVDRQPFSLKELNQRKKQVTKMLRDQGVDNFSVSVDFRNKGKVDVIVAKKSGTAPQISDIKSTLPISLRADVNLTVSDKPAMVPYSAFGGMYINISCTSGWSVFNRYATTGVTSSSHCNTPVGILHEGEGWHSMTLQQKYYGSFGDVAWSTTVSDEPPLFFASENQIRNVNSVEPHAGISINEPICFYGRGSNRRDCNTRVVSTINACNSNWASDDNLVRMSGNSMIFGDSGGGASYNTRVFGSVSGWCNGGTVFTVADLYDEAIGVKVRTTSHRKLKIRKTGPGSGSVTSSPRGISCGYDCGEFYNYGTVVRLYANTSSSITPFFGGDADCNDGVVTMNRDVNCTVHFEDSGSDPIDPPIYPPINPL
ncbi:MAG: hypothetical protein OEY52_02520 [Gammaproteobacteria bacterium]|nr:hypothetical protein [Gammaproteobacteria bacterium]